jgi:hypothetical protein
MYVEDMKGERVGRPTVMVHPIQDVADLHVMVAVAVDCDEVATL